VDNPGARLNRGNLILSVGVAFGPSCEGVTGLDIVLLSTAVGELAGADGAEFTGPVVTGPFIGSAFRARLVDLC
jgi:hypothetical protein